VSEPVFLTLDEVLRIHTRSLAEHGGSEGIRDRGLVESAVASAKNTIYYGNGDLFDVAASYAFHLAESQAFLDGNKRTAVAAAMVFLALNGTYAQPAKWELISGDDKSRRKEAIENRLGGYFPKGRDDMIN
jgi:death on curing protein